MDTSLEHLISDAELLESATRFRKFGVLSPQEMRAARELAVEFLRIVAGRDVTRESVPLRGKPKLYAGVA